MDREEDRNEATVAAPLSKGDLLRARLMVVAAYAQRWLAPVLAVAALLLALFALNSPRVEPAQLSALVGRVEALSGSLTETRNELETLKLTLAHERAQRGDERRKQEEQDAMIIQSVTRLQVKLKITPTLEEQLRAASAPAAAPITAAPPVSVVPAAVTKPQAQSVPVAAPSVQATKAVVPTAKSVPTGKPATALPKPAVKSQAEIQAEALKAAIEKLNQQ